MSNKDNPSLAELHPIVGKGVFGKKGLTAHQHIALVSHFKTLSSVVAQVLACTTEGKDFEVGYYHGLLPICLPFDELMVEIHRPFDTPRGKSLKFEAPEYMGIEGSYYVQRLADTLRDKTAMFDRVSTTPDMFLMSCLVNNHPELFEYLTHVSNMYMYAVHIAQADLGQEPDAGESPH